MQRDVMLYLQIMFGQWDKMGPRESSFEFKTSFGQIHQILLIKNKLEFEIKSFKLFKLEGRGANSLIQYHYAIHKS